VFRRGSTRDLSVTVGEFEPTGRRRAQAEPEKTESARRPSALGLTVSDLTEAQKKELRVRGGVRVEAVDGAAARAGLREGDVILSLDNTEITDASSSPPWRRQGREGARRSACWCGAATGSTTCDPPRALNAFAAVFPFGHALRPWPPGVFPCPKPAG
jgi:hypothetical protein